MPRFVLCVTLKAELLGFGLEQTVQVLALGKDDAPEQTSRELLVLEGDSLAVDLRQKIEQDGITVEQLRNGGENFDDKFVGRWLTAKGRDINAAAAAIRAHAEWRKDYVPAGRIEEEEISGELAAQKAFMQGCDDQGRSLIIFMGSQHSMADRNVDETQRLICYVMDNAGNVADEVNGSDGKVCCLFDLTGLKMQNLDAKGLSAIFDVLQQHYPERLAVLWFLNAPFLFWGVWRLVSPFVNTHTREKIKFVAAKGDCGFLQDVFPPSILPKRYGGLADFIPVEQAVKARVGEQKCVVKGRSLAIRTKLGDRIPNSGTPVRRVNLRNWLIRWRASGAFGGQCSSPGRRRVNLRNWVGNRWRDIRSNPATRVVGVRVNHWVGFLRSRFVRRKEGLEGQYVTHRRRRLAELRKSIIRRDPSGHIRIMDRRVPVRAIVVRVLIAELLIIMFNRARFAAVNVFGWGEVAL